MRWIGITSRKYDDEYPWSSAAPANQLCSDATNAHNLPLRETNTNSQQPVSPEATTAGAPSSGHIRGQYVLSRVCFD